ncbi:hypothetical protein HJA87_06215 [Rhizobium bangladeshense]|uniref:Mob protein n=1 Tax=Rhizobium bangladeshense TaxID=1138189 RepID=A0ABS7LFC4_9HYPH|nr:plasmid recombination protein [Rhizobium bangladeshense]MBY3589478.1 hypothetical protein [Rhizobium bangladeshense]
MAYQFIHLESFSRKADSKGRGTAFIFGEARRDPAASVHVPNPSPPVVVYGATVDEVEALHDAAADAARTTPKDGKPRKLRQDHKTLHTVVASHPLTMEEVRADPAKRREAEEWERRTVAWLRAQYGDDLKSVVRHEDESHFHVHAYIVPASDPEMRAARHHPGTTAKRAVMAAGPAEGEDTKALSKRADRKYKAAMRAWQDSYHEAVAVPCGLTRLGPQRRRLTREEWQAEKTQARALRAAIDRANTVKGKVESFVATKKMETESMVSTAETTAAALRAEADATKAEADRRLAEAKAATDAALKAQDRAIAEQRKARGMMSRVRAEAARVREASARLQRLPSLIRTAWDGFRQSRVADRIRASVEREMERLREQATSAADRASKADADRKEAVERARILDQSLTETTAQRDAARKELARLRPPEPEPFLRVGYGMKPTPGQR